MIVIRPVTATDEASLMTLAEQSGLFAPDHLAVVQETLTAYLSGTDDALWFTTDTTEPFGVLYCAPEVMAEGVWNGLMLIVHPDSHGQGIGTQLMQHAEQILTAQGARLLLVETSSLDDFERARRFYAKLGFSEEARIAHYYAEDDAKVVFAKRLTT
ncbi:MAG: N-acetyltransferase [Rhodothermales bacterium]